MLVFGGLVTWRLSNILAKENGPLEIFARFRAHLASVQENRGGWFDMVTCVKCISMFIGAVVAVVPAGDVYEWFMYALAFSAITALIERLSVPKA